MKYTISKNYLGLYVTIDCGCEYFLYKGNTDIVGFCNGIFTFESHGECEDLKQEMVEKIKIYI